MNTPRRASTRLPLPNAARAPDISAGFAALPLLISREQAAQVTGLSKRFLDYRIAEGSIKTAKVGSRRLILRDSLCAFVAASIDS